MRIFQLCLPVVLFALTLVIYSPAVEAAGKKRGGKGVFAGGSLSFGAGLGVTTAEQDSLNYIIKNAKSTSQATTGELSAGTEFYAHATFRFSNNLVAIQLRPSYFTQSQSGSGTGGAYNYSLSGFTFFPLVRLIPLSNDIIDFYLQAGLGMTKLDGDITNGPTKVSFSGVNFGTQIGLGADFCFVPDHCIGVEGNYRYLPIPRNIVKNSSGGLSNNITQITPDSEFEADNSDVSTKLTGISGLLMYTFNF